MVLSVTGVVVPVLSKIPSLELGDVLWIAIFTAIMLAIGPALFGLMEALGFNAWMQDCKVCPRALEKRRASPCFCFRI